MNIEVNDFNGPLDLLLHLIKTSKMDIYDIDIKVITKEYIDYINNNKELTIDACSEYLVMASELIHLKSKQLFYIKEIVDKSKLLGAKKHPIEAQVKSETDTVDVEMVQISVFN